MEKMTHIKKGLFIALGISVLLIAMIPLFVPQASAYALADLDAQINLALDYLDRMAYFEINSTHAVATDCPSLSFRMKRSDSKWTINGKLTDVNLPSSATMIKGGCYTTDDKEGGTNDLIYYWDINGDNDYKDVVMKVDYYYSGTDNKTMTCNGTITSYVDKGVTMDLWLENDPLITTVAQGKTFTRSKLWGWEGRRYTIRPTTKGLADLYYQLNLRGYSSSRGVDYYTRSQKLYRTWYGSGYILDRFDGMYNVTLKERPFSAIHGGIAPNPDLIREPTCLTFQMDYTPYWINPDKAQNRIDNWFTYANAPLESMSGGKCIRSSVCARYDMPDEEWNACPFQCTTTDFCYAYKSRTGFNWARNVYIGNGMEYDLWHWNYNYLYPALPGRDMVLGIGTDVKSIRACEDLYKYGVNIPYGNGLSTLKEQFIDSANWDGNGIAFDRWGGLPIGWAYPAYGTHNTATYLNALTQYYKVSSDTNYVNKADQVAGVLLQLQCKLGVPIYSKGQDKSFYGAQYVGGFLPGYSVAYSFSQCDIYTAPWIEAIYKWFLQPLYQMTGGQLGFVEDPQPISQPCLANTEVTIPSVWALIEYRTLNRIPIIPTAPINRLSMESATITQAHGGSSGGDGYTEFAWNRQDRVRMYAQAGLPYIGTGWSEINYTWTFTISSIVRNFKSKLHLTIPDWIAQRTGGGNSLTINIELRSGSTLIASQQYIPIDYWQGSSTGVGGVLVDYPNATFLSTLSPGTYTVRLRLYCHAGGGAPPNLFCHLFLGYHKISGAPFEWTNGLPMGIEWFGFDYDLPQCALKTRIDGQFYIPVWMSTGSSRYLKVEKLFTDVNMEGDQTGGTQVYKTIKDVPNGQCNIVDLTLISTAWHRSEGTDPLWNYMADVAQTWRYIDIVDQTVVAQHQGKSGTYSTDLSGVLIQWNGDSNYYSLDGYGFLGIPLGKTTFIIRKNGVYVGAYITFWCSNSTQI